VPAVSGKHQWLGGFEDPPSWQSALQTLKELSRTRVCGHGAIIAKGGADQPFDVANWKRLNEPPGSDMSGPPK
jgi:hypothetical protein